MQITADASALRAAISQAARLVPTKSTLPILSHVLLDVQGAQLQATATDLEASVTLTVPVAVLTEGRAAVPAKLLADWLASVDGPVTLALQPRDTLKLTAGRVTTTLRGLGPDDFPAVQPAGTGLACPILAQTLRRAIDETVYATAKDDSRPVMSGAQVCLAGDTLTLTAADGYRLATRQVAVDAVETPLTVIVPRKALIELSKLCGDATAVVSLSVVSAKNRLEATGDGWTFATRLIEGQFPDWRKIVPREPTTRLTVNRGELLQALRFGGVLAALEGGALRFVVDASDDVTGPATLRVSVASQEHGDHEATVPVALAGAPGRIALNAAYIREALEAFGTGQVAFGWSSDRTPALLEAVDGDGPTAVLMPMNGSGVWPAPAAREAVGVG